MTRTDLVIATVARSNIQQNLVGTRFKCIFLCKEPIYVISDFSFALFTSWRIQRYV